MRSLLRFTTASLCVVAISCAPAPGTSRSSPASAGYDYATEGLNAVLWTQTAAEYRASTLQAYAVATRMLEVALADATWTASLEQAAMGGFGDLPPAVILDVDETVLDNSSNQARLVLDNADFETEAWHAWVREERAGVVPGALEFTQRAAERGVRIYYLTNRRQVVEDATRANLALHGFPLDDSMDTLLMRDEQPDWTGDKDTRRRHVAGSHRILLVVGDALGDFVSDEGATVAARQGLAAEHGTFWGERWIMLPNPQYGSWDGALIDYEFGLERAQKRARKVAALRPQR